MALPKKKQTDGRKRTGDDAPRLDRDWFKRAKIREDGRVVRKGRPRGRPKAAAPKQAVSLRLDADVVAHFRADRARLAVADQRGAAQSGTAVRLRTEVSLIPK